MRHEPDGTTVRASPVPDQAALHGVLAEVRDLCLPLLSVTRMEDQNEQPNRLLPFPRRSCEADGEDVAGTAGYLKRHPWDLPKLLTREPPG